MHCLCVCVCVCVCVFIVCVHSLVVDTRVGKRVDVVVHVEFLELSLECSHGLVALG